MYLGCGLFLALVGRAGSSHLMCPFYVDVSLSLSPSTPHLNKKMGKCLWVRIKKKQQQQNTSFFGFLLLYISKCFSATLGSIPHAACSSWCAEVSCFSSSQTVSSVRSWKAPSTQARPTSSRPSRAFPSKHLQLLTSHVYLSSQST
uniref:Secreted protein n=1 Tax=Molossus molossus TaxID=27622 RepID=A0A7J8I0W8_MOLMO|nr:hypothetical protein HJG59_010807 [Molossus molossus]